MTYSVRSADQCIHHEAVLLLYSVDMRSLHDLQRICQGCKHIMRNDVRGKDVLDPEIKTGCTGAGLEVLVTNCLAWSSPLPASLLALNIDARGQAGSSAALPQLCAALKRLPGLRDFSFWTDDKPELLTPLLAALGGCALTHLALRHCDLRGVGSDGGFSLPLSLEVVDLSYSFVLSAADWLPCLAALPRCHSINLLGHRNPPFHQQHLSEASAWTAIVASPALKFLVCSYDGMENLISRRTREGLPPINVSHDEQPGVWNSYRAVRAVPPICFGPCALLPTPQLDTTSCLRR